MQIYKLHHPHTHQLRSPQRSHFWRNVNDTQSSCLGPDVDHRIREAGQLFPTAFSVLDYWGICALQNSDSL